MSSPSPSQPVMDLSDWLLLLLLSLLWGASFFFGKIAVSEWPPLAVVLARVGMAAAALLLVVRLSGLSMRVGGRMWLAFFGMGLLNNLIPFGLIFWGQTQIASGLASILNATTPLFGVIVAHLFGQDEKATGLKLAGVGAGIVGVAILMGPDAIGGVSGALLPQLACLAAALSYGFAGLYGRRFRGLPPLVTAAGQVSATTVMTIPLVIAFHPPWKLPVPSAPVALSLIGLALLSTALAYVIFFRIMRRAGGTNVMLVTFLIPVSAILLGWGILGEALLPRHFLGMAAIAAGLALIDGRLFGPARARPA
ncbi:Threonine/homoserine efflux transporter RhtA OS=Bosea thiooxidans OX=53254 GN=SAMN05660750_01669 PE=4 SV=1 [Bosea thiooxidans]|uniref:Threonine/homoserine efflux transporter RhtA n=2 Tax=Bosea thiooxidans TaxID=53254 RepID=A0A1T5D261_9HYPH|nr:DMT family transporter [Bosea thiooxidans]SKB65683.1 Threonine/homoserine efflux transporter RhtA [Bosea thiooxidans]